MKVRVVPRDTDNVFVHGKAGVIEHADGRVYSFAGSVNDSATALRHAYEILWGDEDKGAAAWVREEFEYFWAQGVDLPDAVIKHVAAMANRIEYRSIEAARDPAGAIAPDAVLAERPIYRGGQILRSWQKLSTAETKCAKWRRDNVPVGLREKGLEAPVYFRVSVPIYFVVVRSPSFGVF